MFKLLNKLKITLNNASPLVAGLLVITFLIGTSPIVCMAKAPAPITLSQCLQLSPIEIAKKSSIVENSFNFILKSTKQISDPKLRSAVVDYLNNPAATIMELYPTDDKKEAVKQKLVAAGYLKPEATYNQFLPSCNNPKKAPQPFYSAPGSGYMSHHSYPGGLATHVAVNLKVSLALFNAYSDIYGYQMNKDLVIASQILHDMTKPWVFQWQQDGSCLPEASIAGTGAHHVLTIAEAMHRDLPAPVIVAMACAHTHPGSPQDEEQLVNWIKAAGIIAGKDPIKVGVLAADGKTLPLPRQQEGFITHLGDHDYVLTVPAAKLMITELGEIAKNEYGMTEADLNGKKFNAFRNYVFAQASIKKLHQIWIKGGRNALTKTVKTLIIPNK